MKLTTETLNAIATLQNVDSKLLTSEQKMLVSYASEFRKLAQTIEDLGLTDVVQIHVKVSNRGRKKTS